MEIQRNEQKLGKETYPTGTLIGKRSIMHNSVWMIVENHMSGEWMMIDLGNGDVTTYKDHDDLVDDINEDDYIVQAKLVEL